MTDEKEGNWQLLSNNTEMCAKADERKKYIQRALRDSLPIIINTPIHGSGNTNDENTARKFFSNPDIVFEVTGFNLELLERFKVILAVLSSNEKINTVAFQAYCFKTASLYNEFYNWYHMLASVHVILIHGHQIIDHAALPIGMLSEEAQESNNKIDTNTDTFHRLLATSDPLIYLTRNLKKKKSYELTSEIRQLLIIDDGEFIEEYVGEDLNFKGFTD
uniref:Uncharacterized protein n=1 Tax=Trichogramma kaykai TaxID=54128 RepID=A0ABD2X0Q2_9HYME